MVSERTALALSEKRRRGEKCGGDPPYGFALGPDGRTLVPVASEQATLRWACKLEAGGLSLRAIGAALAEAGHAPRGGRWYPTTVARLLRRSDLSPAA